MARLMLKLAGLLVVGHLLLGGLLLIVEATHGINDQDISFALALLFYYLNAPSVWLLRSCGAAPAIAAVLVAGCAQWTVLAFALAAGCRAARLLSGLKGSTWMNT